jgi:hypothetical protein
MNVCINKVSNCICFFSAACNLIIEQNKFNQTNRAAVVRISIVYCGFLYVRCMKVIIKTGGWYVCIPFIKRLCVFCFFCRHPKRYILWFRSSKSYIIFIIEYYYYSSCSSSSSAYSYIHKFIKLETIP